MSKVSKVLFSEHEVIVSAIALMETAETRIQTNPQQYEDLMKGMLSFFRNYADKYHHAKEEQILFPEMIKKNELLEGGAIQEMLENHEDFRHMLKEAESLIEKKEYVAASTALHTYSEALLDHIAVENEEVFQMLDGLFDPDELDRMYYRFEDCDRELGLDEKARMEELINKSFRIKGA